MQPQCLGCLEHATGAHPRAQTSYERGEVMETAQRYDAELQMFCDATREPAIVMLRFLRWLAERGQLEHAVFGQPAGVYAGAEEE